jgi:hypothetical protein
VEQKARALTELSDQLQKPFPADDIEWRVQSSGFKNGTPWALIMPYVTNRAIQERLDEVFGVMGWSNEFAPVKGERGLSFLCGIKVTYDGLFTTKWDGADETAVENFKGGLSNSMKRAGVQYGIGRYLYNLSTYFADLREDRKGKFTAVIKDGGTKKYFSFNAPKLPTWALPASPVSSPPVKPVISPEEVVPIVTDDVVDIGANACKTMEDLIKWYKDLPSANKVKGSYAVEVKNRRKAELQTKGTDSTKSSYEKNFDEHKKMTTDTMKGNDNLLLELKPKTIPELHKIAEDIGLENYKKLRKADIIISIMDKKNDHRIQTT